MSTDGPQSPQASSSLTVSGRYGTPRRTLPRRTKILLAGAVLTVAVVIAGIFAVSGSQQIESKDVGFSVADAGHITVDFEVTKEPESTVHCAVRALNEQYAVVGWKVVTIGPVAEDQATSSHRVQLRTESLSVSGGVDSCWPADAGG